MKKAIFALFLLLSFGSLWAEDSKDLELKHWAYPVLQRFEAKGWLVLPATRPYNYGQVAELLEKLKDRVTSGQLKLSRADKHNWWRLSQEFLTDTISVKVIDNQTTIVSLMERLVEKDLLSVGDENLIFNADGALSPKTFISNLSSPAHSLTGQVDFGGSLKGSMIFDQRLSFLVEKENAKVEKTSATQTAWRGGKLVIDWSYFRIKLPWLYVTLGRQQHWWGPGRVGTLLVSDNAPAFDALNLKLDYKRIGFESFAGILGTEQQRFFSGHRATIRLFKSLDLGASEVVIYKAKNIDPVYINPLLPFYGTQWNEREDDNVVWAADAAWNAFNGCKVYGELLMDDVQYEQDPPAPQKLGFLAGFHLADPLGLPDTDVKLEYAGNQKWVYGHRRFANRYAGGDSLSIIGHAIGTDADMFDLKLEHRLHPRFNLGLEYTLERHGEGRISDSLIYGSEIIYVDDDPFTTGGVLGTDTVALSTGFLTGTIQRRDLGALYFSWQPWHWMVFDARFWLAYTKNPYNLPGLGFNDRGAELSLKLDY
ncbi:MAG: capsule assembly Wzi family protein [bacterium]|nr:capsule assembly Wzi family protein [bacterium]